MDGLRAWKAASGTRTYFLYDGDVPLLELDASGNAIASNTWGANGLVSRHSSLAGSVFYTFDEKGDVSERLTGGGLVLDFHAFQAYGLHTGSSSDPFGYKGQDGYYTDAETGLVLATHRYYDPGTGRWLTRDPIGYNGGINLYGYVTNNPVNLTDPLGLDGYWSEVGQVFAGYGDVLNPVNMYKGAAGLAQVARNEGIGAAGKSLGNGLAHAFTDWATTSDPRTFGRSFGNVLLTAAPLIKKIPNPTAVKISGPWINEGGGLMLIRVDNMKRLGAAGRPETQLFRCEVHSLPSGAKAARIPAALQGKVLPHYHWRGPG